MTKSKDIIYKVEIVNDNNDPQYNEHFIQKYWRPTAAIIYLLICLFDFIIAPSWVGLNRTSIVDQVNAIKDLEPEVQMVYASKETKWEPLTLMGNGMFHIAFGAILTGAAVTRGFEKTEREKTRRERALERLERMRARKRRREEDDDDRGIGVGDGEDE